MANSWTATPSLPSSQVENCRNLRKHSVLCLLGNPAPCRTLGEILSRNWRSNMKKHTNLTINGVVIKSYIPCLERGGKRWREVQMWETCVGREARLHTSAEVCANYLESIGVPIPHQLSAQTA